MEVILLQNMSNLGPMGKVVKVKNGYARNYLLPSKKALRFNAKNEAFFESQRSILQEKDLEQKKKFEEMAKVLAEDVFSIIRSAGDTGHLYGSVSSRDIADLLLEKGFNINRGKINLKIPIKLIGVHNVEILLHADVTATITLNIARSTEEMVKQEKTVKPEEEIIEITS